MIVSSWNVNGLRSSADKFIKFVRNTNYDFYCLQEVRAVQNQLSFDLLQIDGYELYLNSSQKKGYSGVAIYSKVKPKKVLNLLNFKQFDIDGRFLELEFENFSLLNLYIPNGGRNKESFEYKFETYSYLFKYLKNKENLIICGDFNIAHREIDLARPNENKNNTMFTPKEREQIDILLNKGLTDSFRSIHKEGGYYSWWYNFNNARQRNIGWRIDYIFVSNNITNKISDAFISKEIFGSDHCPVGVKIRLDI